MEAANAARAHAEHHDAYIHVALHDRDVAFEAAKRRAVEKGVKPPARIDSTRGCEESARVIGGFWADFDIAGDGHAKPNLPTSEREIQLALERVPHKPSLVIRTGGGVHVWWLFKEPWELDTDSERSRATRRSRGWQAQLKGVLNRDMDATFDLARIMRPPGIMSKKRSFMVEVADERDLRYNPSDFEEWEAAHNTNARVAIQTGTFTIDPDAHPNFDKLQLLISLDARFAATWARKRRDLPSQSEYDLSLASMAARAGWKDQEVVNLLIAHRRIAGDKEKLRPDYFLLTLGKARNDSDPHSAALHLADALATPAESPEPQPVDGPAAAAATQGAAPTSAGAPTSSSNGTAPPAAQAPVTRRDLIDMIRRVCGVPVVRLVKWLADPPIYELQLTDARNITLGGVDAILNAGTFRSKVAAATNHVMPRLKDRAWEPVAQAFLRIVDEVDLGPDSDPSELIREWVRGYCAAHPPSTEDNYEAACRGRAPFEYQGATHLFLESFLAWCRSRGAADSRLGRFELSRGLKSLKADRTAVMYTRKKDGTERTSCSCYRLPDGLP